MPSFDLNGWMKDGRYLPPPLRDFHDAKEVFKTMHATVATEKNEYAKHITWVAGHCYVIDIFLWFMAKRGWTMQRSRVRSGKEQFGDLAADIEARRTTDAAAFHQMLNARERAIATEATVKHLTDKDTID